VSRLEEFLDIVKTRQKFAPFDPTWVNELVVLDDPLWERSQLNVSRAKLDSKFVEVCTFIRGLNSLREFQYVKKKTSEISIDANAYC